VNEIRLPWEGLARGANLPGAVAAAAAAGESCRISALTTQRGRGRQRGAPMATTRGCRRSLHPMVERNRSSQGHNTSSNRGENEERATNQT
jgi:hypothetical protein